MCDDEQFASRKLAAATSHNQQIRPRNEGAVCVISSRSACLKFQAQKLIIRHSFRDVIDLDRCIFCVEAIFGDFFALLSLI